MFPPINSYQINGLARTENSVTTSPKDRQTTITLRNNTKLRMVHISYSMDPTTKISDPLKDSLDTWAKKFCIETVHTRVWSKFQIMPI